MIGFFVYVCIGIAFLAMYEMFVVSGVDNAKQLLSSNFREVAFIVLVTVLLWPAIVVLFLYWVTFVRSEEDEF